MPFDKLFACKVKDCFASQIETKTGLCREHFYEYGGAQTPTNSILQEAMKIAGAGEERARDYGHPLENHQRIASIWNVQLGDKLKEPITAREVALLMIGLKLAREINTAKRDNIVDIAGYAACIGDIDEAIARGKNGV